MQIVRFCTLTLAYGRWWRLTGAYCVGERGMQAMELARRHGLTDERIVAARPYAPAGRSGLPPGLVYLYCGAYVQGGLGTADSSAECSPAGRMSPSWPSATG